MLGHRRSHYCRTFSHLAPLCSGHNRWSTIKHDKGKNDATKNKQRSGFAKEIAYASRLLGPDVNNNPRLAVAINTAKKAGYPKQSIQAAIARGQGHSVTGALLEPLVIEAMLPPAVAAIIDCQTDNKLRTLQDLRPIIKEYNGSTGRVSHLFERKGRIALKAETVGVVNLEDVMEKAFSEGALDVNEDQKGRIVVTTEPSATKAVEKSLSRSLGMGIESSGIVWEPHQYSKLDDEDTVRSLIDMVAELKQDPAVEGVYINAAPGLVAQSLWSSLQVQLGPD